LAQREASGLNTREVNGLIPFLIQRVRQYPNDDRAWRYLGDAYMAAKDPRDAAKAFAVLCCTWNGLPLIYSGQELPNYKRLLFFEKDFIEWTGQCALHEFYKKLLGLRKTNPALRAADPATAARRVYPDDRCFAFVRKSGEFEVLVFLNFSPDQLSIPIDGDGRYQELFTGQWIEKGPVVLPPWGYGVYEKK